MPLSLNDMEQMNLNGKLHNTDDVFYCEATKEIFTDYNEYYKRVMLLNAMIWTCEITGKQI